MPSGSVTKSTDGSKPQGLRRRSQASEDTNPPASSKGSGHRNNHSSNTRITRSSSRANSVNGTNSSNSDSGDGGLNPHDTSSRHFRQNFDHAGLGLAADAWNLSSDRTAPSDSSTRRIQRRSERALPMDQPKEPSSPFTSPTSTDDVFSDPPRERRSSLIKNSYVLTEQGNGYRSAEEDRAHRLSPYNPPSALAVKSLPAEVPPRTSSKKYPKTGTGSYISDKLDKLTLKPSGVRRAAADTSPELPPPRPIGDRGADEPRKSPLPLIKTTPPSDMDRNIGHGTSPSDLTRPSRPLVAKGDPEKKSSRKIADEGEKDRASLIPRPLSPQKSTGLSRPANSSDQRGLLTASTARFSSPSRGDITLIDLDDPHTPSKVNGTQTRKPPSSLRSEITPSKMSNKLKKGRKGKRHLSLSPSPSNHHRNSRSPSSKSDPSSRRSSDKHEVKEYDHPDKESLSSTISSHILGALKLDKRRSRSRRRRSDLADDHQDSSNDDLDDGHPRRASESARSAKIRNRVPTPFDMSGAIVNSSSVDLPLHEPGIEGTPNTDGTSLSSMRSRYPRGVAPLNPGENDEWINEAEYGWEYAVHRPAAEDEMVHGRPTYEGPLSHRSNLWHTGWKRWTCDKCKGVAVMETGVCANLACGHVRCRDCVFHAN